MGKLDWFYKSQVWIDFRALVITERSNADGTVSCENKGCKTKMMNSKEVTAHHKIELNDENVHNPVISLHRNNILLVCFKCHNQIHDRFGNTKRRTVYVVHGAPCSGKSTWVNKMANDDDLILDYDRLYTAVCNADMHVNPKRLRRNVLALRESIVDQIRVRNGDWMNAYVIYSSALRSDVDRLIERLSAEEVYIEAAEIECLSRAIESERPKEYQEFIKNYFERYTPPTFEN